jgi:hypothetical protein
MLKIKATCETEKCKYNGKTSVFISDVIATQCAACGLQITNIVTEEVTDEPEEIAPVVEVVVEEESTPEPESTPEEVTDGSAEASE